MKKLNVKITIFMLMVISVMVCSNGIAATRTWSGSVSTSWRNPNNWLEGFVPGSNDDVIFDAINSNLQSCILDTTTSIHSLYIDPGYGEIITIPEEYSLSISGDISIYADVFSPWNNNSNIILNGSGNQTIKITNPASWKFWDLTINKPTTDTVFLNSDIYVDDTLNRISGVIDTNGYYITATTALPIELIRFDVFNSDDKVNIIWTTATEKNNNYFIIEKSQDCKYWITVDRIDGNGNSNTIINYSIFDYSPWIGMSYYRLTQVDYDGKFETFPIKSCWFNEKFIIYPNPAKDYLIIPINHKNIAIYNQSGCMIMIAKEGSNDISKLSKGLYFIKIENSTYSFIKQ